MVLEVAEIVFFPQVFDINDRLAHGKRYYTSKREDAAPGKPAGKPKTARGKGAGKICGREGSRHRGEKPIL
jgi:hypothetical protein